MKRKLTAKVQQLNPTLTQFEKDFSKAIIIEPENENILLRKGTIYCIYQVVGTDGYDTELIYKVIHDTFYDTYFQSDNISPIQSLEKTILEAKDKIHQLSNNALGADEKSKINIIAGALWGNVFYMVKYGEIDAFLMKEGSINIVETMSEGNFSAASLVLGESDVLILNTDEFTNVYPPQKLITSNISEEGLNKLQSCMLLRIMIDTKFTDSEVVNFGLEREVAKHKTKVNTQEILKKAKETLSKFKKKEEVVEEIRKPGQKKSPIEQPLSLKRERMSTLSSEQFQAKTPTWKKYVIPAIGGLLVISMIIAVINKDKKETTLPQEETIVSNEGTSTTPTTTEEDTSRDVELKIVRIKPEALYDIKIVDEEANPDEIAVFSDKVVVSERSSGKIFVSDRITAKYELQKDTYVGISDITNLDGLLNFKDNLGYKVLDLEDMLLKEQYPLTNAEVSSVYLDFIYTIEGDTLKRYAKEDELNGITWGQNSTFKNAKDIAIAFNIYVLSKDDELYAYSAGERTDFRIKDLEPELNNAVDIIADNDYEYIYIADTGNKRVVILDDSGNVIKQIRGTNSTDFTDIRGIDVSPEEDFLYILDGSRIFEISLEE